MIPIIQKFKLLSLLLLTVFSLALYFSPSVLATKMGISASPIPSIVPSVSPSAELDRFTLFWPMTAGKTKEDSFYFLKRLKENFRGAFIFGKAEKAEYKVFLATKRLLEADSLVQADKKDLASESFDDTVKDLDEAKNLLSDAKNDPASANSILESNNKLGNMTVLLEFLEKQGKEPVGKIKEVKEKVNALKSSS